MEPILARQSVIIKCSIHSSILIGNYEFYYSCGLLCGLSGQTPPDDIRPEELFAFVSPLLESYDPKNEKEDYLLKMLKGYKVQKDYDGQMAQLLQMGRKEEHMWVRS